MNKRHYEHTLPNIRGSLSNTYGASVILLLFFYQFKLPETKDIVIEPGIQVMAVGNV